MDISPAVNSPDCPENEPTLTDADRIDKPEDANLFQTATIIVSIAPSEP